MKNRLIFYFVYILLSAIIGIWMMHIPNERKNRYDFRDVKIYDRKSFSLAVDFGAINDFVSKRGGLPLIPEDLSFTDEKELNGDIFIV